MSNAHFGPFGQQSRTAPVHEDVRNEPVLVLFNGAYILPSTTYEKAQWESDAQIAARKAMSKRSSRSYAARVSRTRSRKKEILGRPAKPTVDTSFTTHKGNAPRQVYPYENERRNSGSAKKNVWSGLARTGTKSKGLGIMKGTPQPESQAEPRDFTAPTSREPKTADTLTPGSRTWLEISPSDRPIPIGISIPSDSLPDFSPYQNTRQRSESDATLVTPSIIITPAAAMKSVWSPDTESEYTPSVYSRATFNAYGPNSDVPPVPALPMGVLASSNGNSSLEMKRGMDEGRSSHTRNDTLDSAGTAFEDVEFDMKQKDRITSTDTYFEEDEVPLHGGPRQASNLSLDTAVVPTPRRSRGWWNVITTPFEFSRANSVWTQNGRNLERTPDIPMMPQRFGQATGSPATPSTYIWSATEKSPSAKGDSPIFSTLPLKTSTIPISIETRNARQDSRGLEAERSQIISGQDKSGSDSSSHSAKSSQVVQIEMAKQDVHTSSTNDKDATSPLSAMSASPVVGTASIGTVLMPRQVPEQAHPVNIHVDIQNRRPNLDTQTTILAQAQQQPRRESPPPPPVFNFTLPTTTSGQSQSPPHFPPPPTAPHEIKLNLSASGGNSSSTQPPQFPPPPHFTKASPHSTYEEISRASSPVSTDLKAPKKHRKVFNIMEWLPFGRRGRNSKKEKEEKEEKQGKKKSRRKTWCWGCCCCLLILILLAIVLPVVIVVTRKHNNDSKGTGPPSQGTPSQWLNLTGYPPIPTGVSTIAQPEAVKEVSGCIAPSTMWSCAVPKEEQSSISPNKPDQPNFKLGIVFENGTVSDPSKTRPMKRAANPVSAGALIRSRFLGPRAAPSASPAPPSIDDYKFVGNTTDGNQSPFEGEETPFFISLLNIKQNVSSQLTKRADITDVIPPPLLNPDGTAGPANLLPNATGQPLRLFNRGQDDEYYGFFVYYDRSIFLKEVVRNNTRNGNPADKDGGSPFDAATLRCTWAQTRFLIQIWTRSQTKKPLLGTSSAPSSEPDFKRPGSFPYPVTITVDRHGGDQRNKMAYCYGMDSNGKIANTAQNKQFLLEARDFEGNVVNPSQGINQEAKGPIDGGTGGCRCQWQNWLD